MPEIMTADKSVDKEQLDWIEVQKRILRAKRDGDFSRAFAEVNDYIASQPPQELHSEALAYRALLHEDSGHVTDARADLLSSLALSEPAAYGRYTIQLSLAAFSRRAGEEDEAVSWFLEALATSNADPFTSGAAALCGLLELKPQSELSERELELASDAARQSWELMGFENTPNLQDLRGTARGLLEAQGRRPKSE